MAIRELQFMSGKYHVKTAANGRDGLLEAGLISLSF